MKRQLYNISFLENKSRSELQKLLDAEKRNDAGRSKRDQEDNIELIEFCINGGASARDESIAKDMMAGQADISDIGGMN